LGFTYGGLAYGLVLKPSRLNIPTSSTCTYDSLKGDEHLEKKMDGRRKNIQESNAMHTSALFSLRAKEVHTSA